MPFWNSVFSALSSSTASTAAGLGAVEAQAYPSTAARVWPLSATMREEMKKGVAYNMKVVLRGMRGTGKTTLRSYLGGHPIPSAYQPSQEISATTIRMCGRGCHPHEGTRVDIWDVVDEGRCTHLAGSNPNHKKELPLSSGKRGEAALQHRQLELLGTVADARAIDVYQGCHLAVFLIHPLQPASLDYAVREAANVPFHTCVVFALNFCDLPRQKRMITMDDVEAACRPLRRATTPFVSELMQGRRPPNEYSVPAVAVSISAVFGTGVSKLVDAFNLPNTLIRLGIMEEKTREVYAQLGRLAFSLTAAVSAAAAPSSSSRDGPREHSGAPASKTSTPPPGATASSSTHVDLSRRAAPRSATATTSTRGWKVEEEGPRADPSARSTASPTAPLCDEHGIQIGFFDDISDSESGDKVGDQESLDSSDGGGEGSGAVHMERRGGASRDVKRRHHPQRSKQRMAAKGNACVSAPAADCWAAGSASSRDPSGNAHAVPTLEDQQQHEEEGAVLPLPVLTVVDEPVLDAEMQEAVAVRTAAVDAALTAAVEDTSVPDDVFFTSGAAVVEECTEDGATAAVVVDPKPDNTERLLWRPLATHRHGDRSFMKDKRRSDRMRSQHTQQRQQQEVQVDVNAMLLAMQAAFDPRPPATDGGDNVSEEVTGMPRLRPMRSREDAQRD